MRKIVHYPNKILEERCREVTEFNEDLHELIKDMEVIMNELGGIGIASNQCGDNRRVILVKNTESGFNSTLILINPVVIYTKNDASISMGEGCLSVPGHLRYIERPAFITVQYQDLLGFKWNWSISGITARVILHEIDHLDGIMFLSKGVQHNNAQEEV